MYRLLEEVERWSSHLTCACDLLFPLDRAWHGDQRFWHYMTLQHTVWFNSCKVSLSVPIGARGNPCGSLMVSSREKNNVRTRLRVSKSSLSLTKGYVRVACRRVTHVLYQRLQYRNWPCFCPPSKMSVSWTVHTQQRAYTIVRDHYAITASRLERRNSKRLAAMKFPHCAVRSQMWVYN